MKHKIHFPRRTALTIAAIIVAVAVVSLLATLPVLAAINHNGIICDGGESNCVESWYGGSLRVYSDGGATQKFAVVGSSGNTSIAGTLNVTGVMSSTAAITTASYLQGGATAAVASATTIAPCAGDVCHITGTTNITDMSGYDTYPGRSVCLVFDGVLTFTDGNHLKLAGNLSTTADDVICLTSDGANWFERARSVN